MSAKKEAPQPEEEQSPMRKAWQCEQKRLVERVTSISEAYSQLINRWPPEIHEAVNRLLNDAGPDTRRMLDAWRECGTKDSVGDHRVDIRATGKCTMTAFGLACLAAYAKAFEDAAQKRLVELRRMLGE